MAMTAHSDGASGRSRRLRGTLFGVLGFLAVIVTTVLGLLAVTFFIGRIVPVDPVLAVLGDRAPASAVARVRAEMGLDLPLWQQFAIYVRQVLSGDLGTSVLTTNPVLEDIARSSRRRSSSRPSARSSAPPSGSRSGCWRP